MEDFLLQKDTILQSLAKLKLPKCLQSNHNESMTALCIDQQCDQKKLLDCICEECQFSNIHKKQVHKTGSIKFNLRNIFDQASQYISKQFEKNEQNLYVVQSKILEVTSKFKIAQQLIQNKIDQLSSINKQIEDLHKQQPEQKLVSILQLITSQTQLESKQFQQYVKDLNQYVIINNNSLEFNSQLQNESKQQGQNSDLHCTTSNTLNHLNNCLSQFDQINWNFQQLENTSQLSIKTQKQFNNNKEQLQQSNFEQKQNLTPKQKQKSIQQFTEIQNNYSLAANQQNEINIDTVQTEQKIIESQKIKNLSQNDEQKQDEAIQIYQKDLNSNKKENSINQFDKNFTSDNEQLYYNPQLNQSEIPSIDEASNILINKQQQQMSQQQKSNDKQQVLFAKLEHQEIKQIEKEKSEIDKTIKMLHIKIQKLQTEIQQLTNEEQNAKTLKLKSIIQNENEKKFLEKEKMIKESYQAIQFYKDRLNEIQKILQQQQQ